MKNKAGKFLGFIIGAAGFLLLFKIFALPHIPKQDEVPPGVVMMVAVCSGVLFAVAGTLLQNYFVNKKM